MRKAFFHKVSDVLIVAIGRYWLIHDGTKSIWGATCWYLVLLVQYKAVLGEYKAQSRAQSRHKVGNKVFECEIEKV